MSPKVAMAITLSLAAAAAWAQSPAPAPSAAAPLPVMAGDPNSTSKVIARFGRNRNSSAAAQAQLASRERVQEMESTVNDMHGLLKQMQAKNVASRSKDPVAKANLEMWELLLAHLDKQLHEMQLLAAREDFEARRAALYKQADEKAAQAAQDAASRQTPLAPPTPVAPKPNQPRE